MAHGAELPLPDWPGQVAQPLAVYPCGPQPKQVAIHPDRRELWVTMLDGPPSLKVFDLRTGEELASLDFGEHGSVEVIFTADGTKAYASQMETHLVFEVDVASRTVLRTFDARSIYSKVVMLSHDESELFVANWLGNDISVIDLATGKLTRRLATVETPRGLASSADGKFLYVAGYGSGELERLDPVTGARKSLFTGGKNLRHIAMHGAVAFISDMGKASIYRLDASTNRVSWFARTDGNPNTIDLSDDGKVLFVSNRGSNGAAGYLDVGPIFGSVLLIDTATGVTLDSIIGGNQTTGLDVRGDLLAFSDFRDDTCRVYKIPDFETLKAAGWPRKDLHKSDLKKK